MNTKIIATIIAVTTALSITIMACSGGDYEDEYYEPTEDTSVEYTSSDTDSPEDTNSSEDTFEISEDENAVGTQDSEDKKVAGTQDPTDILGKTIQANAQGEDNTYENAFLNLKMSIPSHIWISDPEYLAKDYNVSVNEWPSFAVKKIESGTPIVAQYASIDMDAFKVTIVKDSNYSKEKYFEDAANNYKTTNGDLPPQNVSSEVRSVSFLGENSDVLTMRGTLGEENYIANYLYYSKDGYIYLFELNGFSDFINYFEKATTLN